MKRLSKGTLLGTPNREPQEYNRNIMEYKDPGRYIPIIFLLYSWGSLFGVPSKVPLSQTGPQSKARVSLDVELLGPGFAYWLLVGKMGIYLHNPLHKDNVFPYALLRTSKFGSWTVGLFGLAARKVSAPEKDRLHLHSKGCITIT